MDQSESTEISTTTDEAVSVIVETTPIRQTANTEIINVHEVSETPPPPSEGGIVGAPSSTTKPTETIDDSAAVSPNSELVNQPLPTSSTTSTTSIIENVPNEIEVAQPAQPVHLQDGGVATLAAALITEALASIQDEITVEEDYMQMQDSAEVPDTGTVPANIDVESDLVPSIETNDLQSNDEGNVGENDESLRFERSPLIEPMLEDYEMDVQTIEAEEQVVQNDGEDHLMLEDISDDASSSSDAVFNDDTIRAAARVLVENRSSSSEDFMQSFLRAFFTTDHNRERRRRERENIEMEPEEPEPENPITFDTNLPAEHSYLGNNMNRVSGVNYLEVGQQYHMMLFMHQHILFPGEVLPFMISGTIIESDRSAQNGLLFGICFPILCDSEQDDNFYGVTCQIYEKGTDESGNTLIKSRALQRFVTKGSEVSGPLQFIAAHPQLKCYGYVNILPEIFLREPLKCIDMGSLNRFRDIQSMHDTYKRYQAATTPWPAHVYDYYSITAIVEKARSQLAQHKINTMPTDPTQLSFWLVRNLHLSDNLMKTIFMTDSVNVRMKLISNTFTEDSVFTCRYCGNRIANCRQLFAMSKHGVQTHYCNSAGYIHETNTVYQLLPDAVTFKGVPSSEFSWFPGYEWHIIVCKFCSRHIGWKFKALEPNMVPKSFFGISSSSVSITSPAQATTNTRPVVF